MRNFKTQRPNVRVLRVSATHRTLVCLEKLIKYLQHPWEGVPD